MQVSCKLSASVAFYLESQQLDTTELWERSSFSREQLQDPSFWISAQELERWLEDVLQTFRNSLPGDLIEQVGLANPQLHAWGALDSVLKLMNKPQDVWTQPSRFLSYFIFPEPPVENLKKERQLVSFDLPLAREQYPLTTKLLKCLFETLPVFMNQPVSKVEWSHIHVRISFADSAQQELSQGGAESKQLSPDLGRELLNVLQSDHKSLENQYQNLRSSFELLQLENQTLRIALEKIQQAEQRQWLEAQSTEPHRTSVHNDLSEMASVALEHNLSALQDYMTRAEQLIVLLVGSEKSNPVVQQSMKKVDWDKIPESFKNKVAEARAILKKKRGEK